MAYNLSTEFFSLTILLLYTYSSEPKVVGSCWSLCVTSRPLTDWPWWSSKPGICQRWTSQDSQVGVDKWRKYKSLEKGMHERTPARFSQLHVSHHCSCPRMIWFVSFLSHLRIVKIGSIILKGILMHSHILLDEYRSNCSSW